MHVNLPFANDQEFAHLHNAIRLILPIIPAISASTPILDGKPTGLLDSRLDFYGRNQQKIPNISGNVIPEFISSKMQYEQEILQPMYAEINAYDPGRILQYEWLNSRAAIAKFASMAVEIRIIDSQECVNADIAIAHAIYAILKNWHQSPHLYMEKIYPTQSLRAVYDASIKKGFQVLIDDKQLLEQWQLPKKSMTLHDVWSFLIERVSHDIEYQSQVALEHILSHGSLSERILRAYNNSSRTTKLTDIYRQLGQCLIGNHLFSPTQV
jgi:gamma-glutamyl:cysteine ligase YbdK (ATP-grasp superfamily)